MGEWQKTHNPIGRVFINCNTCGWIILPEGTKFGDTKNCPICKNKVDKNEKL